MSSFRSQSVDSEAQQPKHTSRIPTKAGSAESSKPSKAAQHVSKLAKRASRSLAEAHPPRKSSTTSPIPATTTPQSFALDRAASVTPFGMTMPAPPTMRTPSLVSGSSISTFDSPRSNALRRKPSGAIDRYAAQKRGEAGPVDLERDMSQNRSEMARSEFDDAVLGISLPPTLTYADDYNHPPLAHQSFYHQQSISQDLTPPTLGYAPSATPSTRYTDSPFSHVPTPSSASSCSPALFATGGGPSRPRQPSSPTRSRPPVSGRPSTDEESKLGLAPVRESSTSSSNSTVRPLGALKQSTAKKFPPPKIPNSTISAKNSTSTKSPTRKKLTKEPTPSPSKKRPVQAPPELAHLNVDPASSKLSVAKSPPPARPSRDGISNISDMNGPSPVVQSDLPRLYTSYHKRTPSQETPPSATSPTLKTRFGFSSRASSRNESPRIDSAISPPAAARQFHRGEVPAAAIRESRKDSPAVGTGPSPSKSPRFAFFSRKPKTDVKPIEKPKRQPTKGPIAGTGHEGYGRFGIRGRSGSSSSSAGFRSPSSDSTSSSVPRIDHSKRKFSTGSKDAVELDEFLRERLNPVVLRGSGSTYSNAGSSSDLVGLSLHPTSSKSSSLDSYPKPRLLPSAMQSNDSLPPEKRPVPGRRKPSDSSEDDLDDRYSSLATRRSLTRLSQTGSRSPVRVPAPIITSIPPRQSSVDSYDAETSAWPQTDSSLPPIDDGLHGREGMWLRSPSAEPFVKQSRRWNFFQRATASPRPKGKERAVDVAPIPEPPVRQSSYRAVAHYALMDSAEPIGLDEVERIVQENETSPEESMSESNAPSKVVPYERRHTSLLPSPPHADYDSDADFESAPIPPRITVQRLDSSESPELLRAQPAYSHQTAQVVDIPRSPNPWHDDLLTAPAAHTTDKALLTCTPDQAQRPFGMPEDDGNSPRQPRLSPIGRIPAVVSRRDRDRKLSSNSFSRPFARNQPRPSVKPPGSVYSQIREMASPIEPPVSTASTRSEVTSTEPKSSTFTNAPSTSTTNTSMDVHSPNEFFDFPVRKDSEQSYSSSSGNPSWMQSVYSHPPQQDDIWNEYNEFMDEVIALKTPTTGSSFGAPFQYANMLFDHSAFSTPALMGQPPTSQLPMIPRNAMTAPVLSVPQQISKFLQPSLSPMTPDTISAFIGGYGNRSTSTLFTSYRTSVPHQQRASVLQPSRTSLPSGRASITSSRHSRGSAHSRSASLPEANARTSQSSVVTEARHDHETQLMNIAEIPADLEPSANLRLGALMTSKWLSFGRILSSPAHNEMLLADEPRILVIDGLSSDWSYYIALSYPSSNVYHMADPSSATSAWPDMDGKPPTNHRKIPLANISASFPFPKGFFTAVVFRFPMATTEQAYAACISECKRVLRPGGFLEVAVLDLDLMNMGAKARRAVRGLKTRMQQQDPKVCLSNLSDILIKLLGRCGFESVQRCIVGVPAAGSIPKSQDLSSASSGSSGRPAWRRESRTESSKPFTFSELLEDARCSQFEPGKGNDESITKMVAKVGRWWYSSCYEKALLPADRSIWGDSALLRESEKQGTSFRLLICHAQKPTQPRRRTVSV